ncbi:hypothetical protein F4780DRAFT_755974, partial [Xylariomycetidae sp. FL0641]
MGAGVARQGFFFFFFFFFFFLVPAFVVSRAYCSLISNTYTCASGTTKLYFSLVLYPLSLFLIYSAFG